MESKQGNEKTSKKVSKVDREALKHSMKSKKKQLATNEIVTK